MYLEQNNVLNKIISARNVCNTVWSIYVVVVRCRQQSTHTINSRKCFDYTWDCCLKTTSCTCMFGPINTYLVTCTYIFAPFAKRQVMHKMSVHIHKYMWHNTTER